HRTRFGSEAAARAAAVLLLTLRGTPFLYQGKQLGLEDAVVPPERAVDPRARDGCRALIPWDASPAYGWPAPPWLPWPPEPERRHGRGPAVRGRARARAGPRPAGVEAYSGPETSVSVAPPSRRWSSGTYGRSSDPT